MLPILDEQNGIVDGLLDITLQSGFHWENTWVDKQLPKFQGLVIFGVSSFVLSLLGGEDWWRLKGSAFTADGLVANDPIEQKPILGNCISPKVNWCWSINPHSIGLGFWCEFWIPSYIPLLIGMKPPFFPCFVKSLGISWGSPSRPSIPCPTWGAASWWWAWTPSRLGL